LLGRLERLERLQEERQQQRPPAPAARTPDPQAKQPRRLAPLREARGGLGGTAGEERRWQAQEAEAELLVRALKEQRRADRDAAEAEEDARAREAAGAARAEGAVAVKHTVTHKVSSPFKGTPSGTGRENIQVTSYLSRAIPGADGGDAQWDDMVTKAHKI